MATLTAFPVVATSPAEALRSPASEVQCLVKAAQPVAQARRLPDTPSVSAAERARVNDRLAAATRAAADTPHASVAGRAAVALPVYRIKVQIHIIHGRHKRERAFKRHDGRQVFHILQDAYNGAQSPWSQPMGIVFDLRRITVTKNDRWYHAKPMSHADRQMKHRLHRGKKKTLNIYINKPKFAGGGLLLGYSRFPWQYHVHPSLDGVTVNVRSLPGGNAHGYNLGDTVVHETGHWLGLLHTFEGGNGDPTNPQCSAKNDGVADTPAEYAPNFSCVPPALPTGKSTVCDPQAMLVNGYVDPAFNFMDYSLDGCMRMFTLGQRQRIDSAIRTFRFTG